MSDDFDPRGCITDQGFAALEASPPGRGRREVVEHLATCDRCQSLMLTRGEPSSKARAWTNRLGENGRPSLLLPSQRTRNYKLLAGLLVAALFFLLVSFLYLARQLG